MPNPSIVKCRQKALYWEKTGQVNDQLLLAAPVELRTQWTDKRTEMRDPQSNVIALDSQIETLQQLVPGSLLWRGGFSDWHGAGLDTYGNAMQVETVSRKPDNRNRQIDDKAGCKRWQDWIPGGWHLQRIPDLELWLHGDQNVYTTSTGTATPDATGEYVGRWTSLDVNAKELKQATSGYRPTLRLNEINTSRQAVRFDGSDDSLAKSADIPLTADFTVYLAGTITTTLGLKSITATDVVDAAVGSTARIGDGSTTATANYTGSAGDVVLRFRRTSGNVCYAAATGQAEATLSGTPTGTINIGRFALALADWRHVLIFSRDLETWERQAVENYLSADVGVTIP